MAAKLTDDILKWTLDIDGQPAMKALGEWEQKTRSVERANKALETEMAKLKARGKENTDEYRALEKQMKTNNATIRQAKDRMAELRKEVGITGMTMQQLRQRSKELKGQLDRTVPNSAEWKKLRSELDATEKRMKQVGSSSQKTGGIMGKIGGMMPFMGWAAAGAAVVGAIGGIFSKAVEVRTEFSKYEAVLKNTLGSQEAMNAAFSDLKKFAANTPFQLAELTDSYVKLTNSGFQPTMAEMTKMGDLAAAMGKPFDQLTEAVIDAQTGENERLKEFGIKAQKNGDKINYTFKGVTTEVDNNAEAIRNYILSLGDMEGVKGGMDAISKTVGGAISNSKDSLDNFFNVIGTKLEPIIVKVLGWFTSIMNSISDWIAGAGEGFDQLYNWFAEFYNASLPLRAGIEYIEMIFKNAFAVVSLSFKEMMNGLKTAGKLLKAVFTGDFASIPDILEEGIEQRKENLVGTVKKIGNNAKDAWNDTVNGKMELKTPKPDTADTDAALAAEKKKQELAAEKKKQDAKKAAEKAQKANEEAAKKAIETLEKQQKSETAALKTALMERGATKETTEATLQQKELEHLAARLALQKKYGQDTADTELAIADKQLKIREDFEKQRAEIDKAVAKAKEEADKSMADFDKEQEKEMLDGIAAEEQASQEKFARYEELRKTFQSTEKTDKEAMLQEMADLEEAFRAGGILSQEEYERKKAEINSTYVAKRIEKEQEYLNVASSALSGFSDFFSAMKDAELAKAGDNKEKQAAIEKKYAKKQQGIAIGQALISGALAVMEIWKTPSVLLSPAAEIYKGVMTGLMAGTTIANVAKIKSQQFAKGRYNVQGASDGQLYSASFVGRPKTGVYNETSLGLFSEKKREAVIDGNTTEKLLWNYPHVWNGITTLAAGGVPQFADGRYPASTSSATGTTVVVQQSDPALLAVMQQNAELLAHLKQNGVQSNINALEIRDKQNSYDAAVSASEM